MELLQSQARTERELSGIPADRSFGILNRSLKDKRFEIRDGTLEKGRCDFGTLS